MNLSNYAENKKYGIPLNHLDYAYIDKCTDVKELEKIVKLLRSGDEGAYPQLEECAEKQLAKLNPKSRILRKEERLKMPAEIEKEEWSQISSELEDWTNSYKSDEMNTAKKSMTNGNHDDDDDDLPPVRGTGNTINLSQNSKSEPEEKKTQKRVKPRDYREWDKFDIDAELEKVDNKDDVKEKVDTSNVLRNPSKPNIPDKLDTKGMKPQEKLTKAEREKDKGNEAFRAADYEEAILYYTRSLSILSNTAARNNRAQAYIKVEKWKEALSDCNAVLKAEPENMKALLRRSVARKGKKDFVEAKEDIEKVLEVEPKNKRAMDILQDLEKELADQKVKGRRMVIEESSDEEEEVVSAGQSGSGDKDSRHTQSQNKVTKEEKASKVEKEKSEPKDIWASGDTENIPSNKVLHGAEEKKLSQPSEANAKTSSSQPPLEQNITHSQDNKTLEQAAEASKTSVAEITPPPPQPPLPPSVLKQKEAGNELFKKGQYSNAVDMYSKAIKGVGKEEKKYAIDLSVLYTNRAVCKSKVGECKPCIEDCNKAMELSPGSVKAYLRRAAALETMENFRQAYVDYKKVLYINGNMDTAQQGATRCQSMLQQLDGTKWREKLPLANPLEAVPSQLFSPTPATQEQKDLQAKKARLAREKEQRYERSKESGNTCVKKGNYKEAIEHYSKCIEECPEKAAAYSNRALCSLKLEKAEEAVSDCNKTLEIEPQNVKAMFRRAQALKMMKKYSEAYTDLKNVLNIDDKNTAAKKELTIVEKLKDEIPRQKIQIIETDSSSEDEEDVPINVKHKEKPHTETKAKEATAETQPKKATMNGAVDKEQTKSAQKKQAKKPTASTPVLKSATPFEFIQAWGSLKTSQGPEPFCKLLDQVSPQELPKVISNKLDGDMLQMLIKCMEIIVDKKEFKRSLEYLLKLTTVPRFGTMTMFMSNNDKKDLKRVISKMEGEISADEISKLKSAYSL